MMDSLSLNTLSKSKAIKPQFDPKTLPISIVHIGPGAFFRAHFMDYIDRLNDTNPRFGVSALSLHSRKVKDALTPQDGLYSLHLLDQTPSIKILGSLRECLFAPEDGNLWRLRLSAPTTLYVSLTITEKAYGLDKFHTPDFSGDELTHDIRNPHHPISVIGILLEGLSLRFQQSIAPFVLLSCDNLSENGSKLKTVLLALAKAQARDQDFIYWLEKELICPLTMVDSITPATNEDFQLLACENLGLNDSWPIKREAFCQFVIEDHQPDPSLGADINWAHLGAIMTSDVRPYEMAKLWMLNATHSGLAYQGCLKNYNTVAEAIEDNDLLNYATAQMRASASLLAKPPQGLDLNQYSLDLIKRFQNPMIDHKLTQIAMDGSQKLPVRILAPLKRALEQNHDIQPFVQVLAAWFGFIRKSYQTNVALQDPLNDKVWSLCSKWQALDWEPSSLISDCPIWDDELAYNPEFSNALTAALLPIMSSINKKNYEETL